MAKDINLTASDWTDIVFEGKNKEYGAYKMRQTSRKRHFVAIGAMLIFVAIVIALPSLIEAVKAGLHRDNVSEVTELSSIKMEDEVKEQDKIKQETAPPPPPLKSTIKFTPPEITEEKINKDDQMKSQEELNDTKVTVSVADVKGTDDKHGVDIADLKDNKVVVQEEEEKPFVGVEQMPQFPGGEAALMQFLSKNIKYPTIAAENGIQGRVTLRFVVSKTGNITDVTVLKGLDPSCDKEAIRVVKSMPNWIPGKQNGRNVPVYYTLPVSFRLQ